MTSRDLINLSQSGQIRAEAADQEEFDALVRSGRIRLADATNPANALESRFDLAYNAAHALSLAALRWNGFRPDKRYVVFQALELTLGIDPRIWRVLGQAHDIRNESEYEGDLSVDEQFLGDLIVCTEKVYDAVIKLAPLSSK
jgi:hypothetical protein